MLLFSKSLCDFGVGTKHVVQAVKRGPETDVAKQTRRWVILYSDKSTTRVEPLTQNLSCLIMQKQVPLGQELLASKVHSHDASMTAICASCLGFRSQSRGVSAIVWNCSTQILMPLESTGSAMAHRESGGTYSSVTSSSSSALAGVPASVVLP